MRRFRRETEAAVKQAGLLAADVITEGRKSMKEIVAIYGSPRRDGNTSRLLAEAVRGAREAGAQVEEVFLRDLKMSPCLETYRCRQTGRCAIRDDFQKVYDALVECKGVMLASPVFFYTVSAHVKILMDRCQSLWVKRYWLDKVPFGTGVYAKKGLFISVGATRGAKLFDGMVATVKYFFDALGAELWRTLLYRGVDEEKGVAAHPGWLEESRLAGRELALAISAPGKERPLQ